MTVINALAMDDAAYMLTDTALYHKDGLVAGFSTKVTTLAHLRMAFATSGSHEQGPRVLRAFDHFTSFDDVTERLGGRLREMADNGAFECVGVDRDDFRLIIIGWSERAGRAQVLAMSTQAEPALEAFDLKQAPVAINPSIHHDVLRAHGLLEGDKPTGASPEEWLTKLVDIQRVRRSGERGSEAAYEQLENGQHVVGGSAVLTKISKHGITQRVVREWHDRAFEFIDPAGRSAA